MNGLLERVVKPSTVAGISLKLLSDNSYDISLSILRNKKGIVTLIKFAEHVTLDHANKVLETNAPVTVAIDGKGVLHRKIVDESEPSKDVLLSKVIPNATPGDFYLQKYDTGDGLYVSLIRRQLLDELLDKLLALNINVVGVHLGPFVISSVLPFLNLVQGNEKEVVIDGYSVKVAEGKIIEYAVSMEVPSSYNVGDETVSGAAMLSYGAALCFLTGTNLQYEVIDNDRIGHLHDEWRQRQIFKKTGIALLAFFFALLLINTLVFVNVSRSNEELLQSQGSNQKLFKEVTRLKEQVEKNKALLQMSGWSRRVPVWYYADRLASTVPDEINFTEIDVFPLDEKVLKDQRKKVFRAGAVTVRGACNKPLLLNDWFDAVKKLDWVKEVTNQTYEYSERDKTGYFAFQISIKE